nr:ribonuclease H-like domain-containing protein [Tanacetum cinerariifolium]
MVLEFKSDGFGCGRGEVEHPRLGRDRSEGRVVRDRIWASAIKLALQARNKFAFVDGSCVKYAYMTNNVLYVEWDICNVVVLTWIINFVSSDVYMGLVYSVDATFVWKELENSKLFVGFNEDTCYIQDLKRETVLGITSESGGLYMFNMDNDKFVGMSNMVMSFNVSKDLWHNRLGHPANQVYQVLYVLKNDMHLSKSVNVTTCEICHRAKQSREPFPLNDHKSEKLGELIHLDLWGLYKSIDLVTYCDVIKDNNWIGVINIKIEALNRNNTWTVANLPAGRKDIGYKWLYKIKYKASGEIDSFKSSSHNQVCQLDKSLYGLEQDPRKRNAKLTTTLVKHGFEQRKHDYSLYIKQSENMFIALLVKFMIKDLGVLKYFLGIEIMEKNSGICMSQRTYCLELLHKFGLLAAKAVTIPLPEN